MISNALYPLFRLLPLCFIMIASTAWAAQDQAAAQAGKTLEASVTRILDDIKNPEFSNPATKARIRAHIEDQVRQIFDFREFSSRTVGPRWREFSAAEKDRFSEAFANLLFNTYLNKINGYNGEQVERAGEMVSPDGTRVEINTIISLKDGKKIPVSYRMLLKNGAWRVYDVIIENISLVKNYRTQFQDILTTATPDQLIARVEARAKEVQAQGSTDDKK